MGYGYLRQLGKLVFGGQSQSLPQRGRWHGEAVPEEVFKAGGPLPTSLALGHPPQRGGLRYAKLQFTDLNR